MVGSKNAKEHNELFFLIYQKAKVRKFDSPKNERDEKPT